MFLIDPKKILKLLGVAAVCVFLLLLCSIHHNPDSNRTILHFHVRIRYKYIMLLF